ncbi:MAG TPA: peroxidase family protein, partial [Bryobacteraceae bacterium]|nr:peroxidase family protein [Bryobacteraceae bacterium]
MDPLGDFLEKKEPWYELPTPLAIPALIAIRDELRAKNLHDTEEPPLAKRDEKQPLPPNVKEQRSEDGSYNDLTYPQMGAENRRFGRNFPLENILPDKANLMNPNPREISQKLLARTEFKPATIINLLAAAWIQFMVHDWFAHKTSASKKLEIPIGNADPWPEKPMKVDATVVDPAPAGSKHPPAYANENTHWWDASQLYGCDDATCSDIRTHADGLLRVSPEGRIPVNPQTGLEITGFTDNNWIGLSMLHGLFALEHNAICAMLKQKHSDWIDEQLFQKARLINTAVLAKIHTVEWTPAIVPHPTVKLAMHTNWFGI